MAENETKNQPKDLVEATPEEMVQLQEEVKDVADEAAVEEIVSKEEVPERTEDKKERESRPDGRRRGPQRRDPREEREEHLKSWAPRTNLGKLVKTGKEKDIDDILENKKRILEPEIVDSLLDLESDLILIGQAKGKFGGGKRRAWRQTQKKTQEGNVLSFSAMAVVGDKKGHVGVGYGKARETLPSREKAVRNAKLNLVKINLGFESSVSEESKEDPHTVPFKVEGKCGSVRITLLPAPRGTGLVAGDECKKILKLAGVKDVYTKTSGKTKTTFNLARACINALEKTTKMEN